MAVLVDANHAGVLGLGEDRVAPHEAVVLVGDPALVGEVRAGDEPQERLGQLRALGGARQGVGVVGVDGVEPGGTGLRAVVGGAVVGDRVRVDVDDGPPVPVDDEPVAVGDLADDRGLDVPPGADRHEALDVVWGDDGHHALLRLAHEDLLGRHRGVAQGDEVELAVHAAVAGAGQLARGAADTGRAEVLQSGDDAGVEELEGALDEELLHEGVAHLDAGALLRAVGLEGLGGEHRGAPDAVGAGGGAEEDHLVAGAGGLGEGEVLVPHDAHAQGVDERVAQVGVVEDELAADVRQAQAVAVAAHAGDDAGQHAAGVGGVEGAEAQGVHDGDRPGAHGHDVADDAADAGGGALVGLDVAGVVVGLGLEGDRVALADVDGAGVVADAGQQRAARGGLRQG